MIIQLIDDMNRALDHDCFFSALSLALTLPDICGKAKYPKEKSTKKRYIDWYDEYVGKYEKCPGDNSMPYLNGEVVYNLRCSMLHQGTPNVNSADIKEEACKLDNFDLLTEKKKDINVFMDRASVCSSNLGNSERTTRSYEVNVRRLCFILSACAKAYYEEHKEQFDFFNYHVVDIDERYAGFKKLMERQRKGTLD